MEYTEPLWRNLNMRLLKVDEAYLILKSYFENVTHLYSQSEVCYTCPYIKLKTLEPFTVHNLSINVAYNRKFKLLPHDVGNHAFDNVSALCDYEAKWGEFGVFNLTLNSDGKCVWLTDKEPVNTYISLLTVCILVIVCLTVLNIGLYIWRSYHHEQTISNITADQSIKLQQNRLRCLDVFRGLTITLMIFVNSGGGGYSWIEHAIWNGLHVADIVFPCFLWIMGVCIPISIKSQLRSGKTKLQICRKVLWRAIKLFLIGLCLNSINGPNLENLRIMGVLQRFSISYLFCAICHVHCTKHEELPETQASWKRYVHEFILMKFELLICLVLILIHLVIIFWLPLPNCPRGYLGPGGLHFNALYKNCIGGSTGFIDKQILGIRHIYQNPTAKHVYHSTAFDPEGIFGCLLTIVQVFMGILAGITILNDLEWKSRIYKWLIVSAVLTICSGFLCGFSQENGFIPINKNLWSLSYVCLTTAITFILLSLLYYLIDIKKWWLGYPFEAVGMNSIIIYIGHTIFYKMLPWHWRIGEMNTHFALTLEAVWNTSLWIVIALYLDNKKLYYNV